MTTNIDYLMSPIGLIKITVCDDHLTKLEFIEKIGEQPNPNTPSLLVIQQLKEYFFDNRCSVELPLNPAGTDSKKSLEQPGKNQFWKTFNL